MSRGTTMLHEGEGRPGRLLATRRRPRVGRLRKAMRLTAAILMLGGAVWGGRWLLTADFFAVSEVRSGPYRFTERADFESELKTALGQNVWTVDTDGLARRLAELPWVSRASVRRRLPAGLKVTLAEWRPVAICASAGWTGTSLLLENGQILPLPEHLTPPDLPVLIKRNGSGGDDLDPVEASRVLELTAAITDTGLEKICPVDFLIVEPTGLSIVLQRNRGRLVLGNDSFGRRLRRYLAVSDRVGDGRVVDLRFDGNVCVREGKA